MIIQLICMKLLLKKTTIIIILPLITASCATVPYHQTADGVLENTMGNDAQQVIQHFGPPDEVFSDGGDGYIFHYDYSYETVRPGVQHTQASADWQEYFGGGRVDGRATTLSTPPSRVMNSRYAQIYINEEGTAHHWRHNAQTRQEMEAERKNKKYTQLGLIYGVGIAAIVAVALAPAD